MTAPLQYKTVDLLINNKAGFRINQEKLKAMLKAWKCTMGKIGQINEMSVAIVSPKEIKKINQRYRKKSQPTDVLSFTYGEIFICPKYAKKKYNLLNTKSVHRKIVELFLHGLAHIAGFNHGNKVQAQKMSRVEQKVLTCYNKFNL